MKYPRGYKVTDRFVDLLSMFGIEIGSPSKLYGGWDNTSIWDYSKYAKRVIKKQAKRTKSETKYPCSK